MRPKNKNDKVVDDTSNEENNEKYLPTSEEKRTKKFPTVTKMLIVLRIEIALHKMSKPSSRITSSQAKHVKTFSFPTILSGPKLPHWK